MFHFVLFLFIFCNSFALVLFDNQISNSIKNFISDIEIKFPELNINDFQFYLTDDEKYNISFLSKNKIYISKEFFKKWVNSDFLFFAISNEISKKVLYLQLNNRNILDVEHLDLDTKFIGDIDDRFSYLTSYENLNIRNNENIIYKNISKLDIQQFNIKISQRFMRNIQDVDKFLYTGKDKNLDFYKNYNGLDLNVIAQYKQMYLNDFDPFNKLRTIDFEDKFNIIRAKLLGLFDKDREKLFNDYELKYFDVRLYNQKIKYETYFNIYKLIQNKQFEDALKLIKNSNYREDLLDVEAACSYYLGDLNQVKELLKNNKLNQELYVIFLIKNVKGNEDDLRVALKNIVNNVNISQDRVYFLLDKGYEAIGNNCISYKYRMNLAGALNNMKLKCETIDKIHKESCSIGINLSFNLSKDKLKCDKLKIEEVFKENKLKIN